LQEILINQFAHRTYKTNSVLEFIDSELNEKYISENRANYSLKALIWVSLFILVANVLIYDPSKFGFWFLVTLASLFWSLYALHKIKSFLISRATIESAFICFHLFWIGKGNFSTDMLMLLPLLTYDLLALWIWKRHLLANIAHLLLLNLAGYVLEATTGNKTEENTALLIKSKLNFTMLVIILMLDLIIFSTLEKLLKENWVLKSSFEKSFKHLMQIIDAHPTKACIWDRKANIIFSNEKFLDLEPETHDKLIPTRLIAFLDTDSKNKFLKELERMFVEKCKICVTVNIINSPFEESNDYSR
jgi:hypothetical protein